MLENELDALSFEEIMDELEKSVSDLENGKLPLNKASEVYEKGMKLAEEANKRLSDTRCRPGCPLEKRAGQTWRRL